MAARRRTLLTAVWIGTCTLGCQDLSRFSTAEDEAYCGSIVSAPFIRSGFDQTMRLRLELDADALQSRPGVLTSDDTALDGTPCSPEPTFDRTVLRVSEELLSDPLSMLSFGDGREQNFLAWADTTCERSFLTVVSLMKNEDVEVRLLGPTAAPADPGAPAFALFVLERQKGDCGF